MKHPGLVKKLHDMEYEKRYKGFVGYAFLCSFLVLLGVSVVVGYFLYPSWPVSVLLTLFCCGLGLCIAISSYVGRKQALAELQSDDQAGPNYRGPAGLI